MQAADDSQRLLFAQAKTCRKDLECPNLEGFLSKQSWQTWTSVIQFLFNPATLFRAMPTLSYASSGQTCWAETLDRATSNGLGILMGDP